jgi:hypothetical protein
MFDFYCCPLGVLGALILVSPRGTILLGVISSWSWVVIVYFFSFLLGIIQMMGWIFCIQLFKSMNLLLSLKFHLQMVTGIQHLQTPINAPATPRNNFLRGKNYTTGQKIDMR